MNKKTNKNNIVLITGASSGLGKCLNKSFSENYNTINISRSLSEGQYNIVTNFNDLSDLKQKVLKSITLKIKI